MVFAAVAGVDGQAVRNGGEYPGGTPSVSMALPMIEYPEAETQFPFNHA